PWSMCPMVPTFTCGLERSNFSFAIAQSPRLPQEGASRLRIVDCGLRVVREVFIRNSQSEIRRVCLVDRGGFEPP
ncbi:MAG: hypothetical protein NTZ98_00215, partial [Acidobacteria bacterium]|nr:hypothetical protein [Acidobacteriota bacterium]